MSSLDQNKFIQASHINLKIDGKFLLKDIHFEFRKGESIAVTGASGSGKTLLGKVLNGDYELGGAQLVLSKPLKTVMVDQQDHFIAFSGRRSMHYAQRYENLDMESVPTVVQYLQKVLRQKTERMDCEITSFLNELEIEHLSQQKILELSNGERKRTQLAVALLQKPDLLILDQPFVGLDFHSRNRLSDVLKKQVQQGVSMVLITDPQQIPDFIHRVLELDKGRVRQFVLQENYQQQFKETDLAGNRLDRSMFSVLPKSDEKFSTIISMKDVGVTLNGKCILKQINWQVKNGEQWALLGANGAGKSTLLSLVTADNPQGYTNDLVLFDRQRGSGESIWDIKRHIGFVSPELHLYFLRGAGIYNTIPGLVGKRAEVYSSLTCQDVIISGFHDEIGFTSQPTDYEYKMSEVWLGILGMDHLRKRFFTHTSLGEQRVILLARALVKSPQLLILDEPCQGLDALQTRRFTDLLNEIANYLQTTLVYVTHLKKEIPTCVSHLLLLEQGEVAYQGVFNRTRFAWKK